MNTVRETVDQYLEMVRSHAVIELEPGQFLRLETLGTRDRVRERSGDHNSDPAGMVRPEIRTLKIQTAAAYLKSASQETTGRA